MSGPFELTVGRWYAMAMYPGYGDQPYHSPIRVERLVPFKDGSRRLDLHFFNLFYATGVQDMTYPLTMLQRAPEFILARHREDDRAISLVELTTSWLQQQARELYQLLARDLKEGMPFYAALEEARLIQPT